MKRPSFAALLPTLLVEACSGTAPSVDSGAESSTADRVLEDFIDAGTPDAADVLAPPPTRTFLRDSVGGAVIFRGVNVSGDAKNTPDHLPPYGVADFLRLHDELGFNAIRFLVFWEAIEPQAGVYDQTYLGAVRQKLREADAAGLRVLVDLHQDVYGIGFGFAGAPRWTCDEALYASFHAPADWFLAYFEPQVTACFDHLWTDVPTRAAFAAAWTELARTLRDEPNILAFEVLNEPFWGSGTPTDFDTTIAPDLYGQLADAIRLGAPGAWVAVEPATTASSGIPSRLRLPARDGLLYAPHLYPPALEAGSGYSGDPQLPGRIVAQLARDAHRLGAPWLVGELGVRRDIPGADAYLRDAYDALDSQLANAFYWDLNRGGAGSYGLWDEAGQNALQARAVARPYPTRTAGAPTSYAWDSASGTFVFAWVDDPLVPGVTEVAIPSLAFPAGVDVHLDDAGTFVLSGSRLQINHFGSGGPRRLQLNRR